MNDDVQRAIDWINNSMWQSDITTTNNLSTILTALRQMRLPSAIQWTGTNLREVIDLVGLNPSANKWTWEEYEQVVAEKGLKIFSPDGAVMANVGDWIIFNGKDCFVTALRQMKWSDGE